MTEYTLLFLGLVIGMILGYFLLKYLFVKNYVPKIEFDELNTKFNNNPIWNQPTLLLKKVKLK